MDITLENYKTLNLKDLVLNSRFGDLKFEKGFPQLVNLQKMFIEFEKLGYQRELAPSEQAQILNAVNQFIEYLKRIQLFDLNQQNPKEVHDTLENQIENFYNSTVSALRNFQTYLRQDIILKSQDQKKLQEEREKIVKTRQELQDKLAELQKDLEKQKYRKKKIEEEKGSIAATQLAIHFAKQCNDYAKEAENWLENRKLFLKSLIILISFNYLVYVIVFFLNIFNQIPFGTNIIFSIEYGIINLSLLSLLFYSLRFASQNYNIFSNLNAVTRHRKNVAQTLDDFLGTNPASEIKDAMIKQGTEAMFKHLPTGYIPKSETKQSDPIIEAVSNFILKRE